MSMIEDGIIQNGELQIDVSAVEKELRKGELYSLSDAIKRYLSEMSGEEASGKAAVIFCENKESKDKKTQTIVFQWRKKKYQATKNLEQGNSEYIVTAASDNKASESKSDS